MRRTRALVVAVLVASPWALAADTYPRQPAVDALHYRFAIALSDDLSRLEGEARATFRLLSPTPSVELDLASPAADKGMRVGRVTLNGHAVPFTHERSRLRLTVPADAAAGHDLTFSISYGGAPAASLLPRVTIHGEPALFSDNWPDKARQWLPMIDHPYDKATGELIVTAPARFQVVSNGALVEEVDVADGRRRTHWKQSVPIASWLFALGVARFDLHHAGSVQGVPLQTWVFPQDRERGRVLFEETSRRALDFFSSRIGPYPYEKLANVQAAGLGGAMENATAIFYGERGVATGRGPVVHEIAHQWFGNSVTERDWDDVWLSEGFATYFANLYTEHDAGRDAFARDLAQSRGVVLKAEQERPDTPVVHRNLADMERVLNPFVYQKGAWILHMLRAEIGTDAFWAGIRAYYRRYRDASASTADFRQVMEQASGRSLDWFFAQWLTRPGVPRVEAAWRYDAATRAVEITLKQTQPAAPFRLAIDLALVDEANTEVATRRVTMDGRDLSVRLPTEPAPARLVLDPGTWLLAEIGPVAPLTSPPR